LTYIFCDLFQNRDIVHKNYVTEAQNMEMTIS